jgi:hypothetical protein
VKSVKGTEVKKEKRGTFPISFLFFKPSRKSVTRREESQASAIDRTVRPVPPSEEETSATTTGAAVLRMVTSLVAGFGVPLTEGLLWIAVMSEQVSRLMME